MAGTSMVVRSKEGSVNATIEVSRIVANENISKLIMILVISEQDCEGSTN